MVKVVFVFGNEVIFNSNDFTHNAEHRIFFVKTPNKKRIMLPDHAVECIGLCDEEGVFL